ncbi:MAG: hypothetical protein HYT80_11560 [Euryarchaeota archaeon]|nr:hypothetical protein [Euryarchaeota archaeon]
MTQPSRPENPLLDAVCHLIVHTYEAKAGESPTGFHFNKYISLINEQTGGPASPLRLPHMWYRWGDEVSRSQVAAQLRWDHTEPPSARVKWDGAPPEPQDDDPVFQQAKMIVDQLNQRYTGEEHLSELIGKVYEYAPFRFQILFREVRESYLDLKGNLRPIEGIHDAAIRPILTNALDAFPATEFPDFRHKVPPFRLLMNSLIDQEHEGTKLAIETSETFWFAFCYHLRLHEAAHANIKRETLDQWHRRLPFDMEHFDRAFNGLLLEAAGRFAGDVEEPELRILVKQAERQQEEDVAILQDFEEDLKTASKYFQAMRVKRRGKAASAARR